MSNEVLGAQNEVPSAQVGRQFGNQFSRHQRITEEVTFARVLKSGHRKFSAHFALYWAAPAVTPAVIPVVAPMVDEIVAPSEFALLGVIVAKKLARTSVERNRIKRLMREAFRQHAASRSGWELVLRLNRPARKIEGSLLLVELAELLRRLPALPLSPSLA